MQKNRYTPFFGVDRGGQLCLRGIGPRPYPQAGTHSGGFFPEKSLPQKDSAGSGKGRCVIRAIVV